MRVFVVAVMLGLAGVAVGEVRVSSVATQPATQPTEIVETRTRVVHPFETLANSMPKKLWPSKDETQAIRTLRADWVKDNFQSGKMPAWNWSGTVLDVQSGPRKNQATVKLKIEDMQIWGKPLGVQVHAILVNPPADVLEWPKGKTVTVKGIFMETEWHRLTVASEFPMTIRTISELPPAKTDTPAPRNKPKQGVK